MSLPISCDDGVISCGPWVLLGVAADCEDEEAQSARSPRNHRIPRLLRPTMKRNHSRNRPTICSSKASSDSSSSASSDEGDADESIVHGTDCLPLIARRRFGAGSSAAAAAAVAVAAGAATEAAAGRFITNALFANSSWSLCHEPTRLGCELVDCVF